MLKERERERERERETAEAGEREEGEKRERGGTEKRRKPRERGRGSEKIYIYKLPINRLCGRYVNSNSNSKLREFALLRPVILEMRA